MYTCVQDGLEIVVRNRGVEKKIKRRKRINFRNFSLRWSLMIYRVYLNLADYGVDKKTVW